MPTKLQLHLNGQPRTLEIASPAPLDRLIALLELRGDRIAVEHNGEIVPRTLWPETQITDNDRLEIVHFVGGGASSEKPVPTKPSSFRLILKNLTAIVTSNIISVLIQLLQAPIFLHSYGSTVYADWIVLSSAVSYLSNLNFGLDTFITQDLALRYNRGELEGFHVQQSTALRALIGISLIAALGCLVIFAIPVEHILNLSISHLFASLALYFIALQVIVGSLVFSYFSGAYMGVGLAHRGNHWQNAQRLGDASLICLLALFHQPLYVLALGQFAWYIVMLVIVIIDFKRKAPEIFPTLKYWDHPKLIAMLKPSAYFGLLFWSNFFGFEMPLILLRKFAGPTPVVVFTLGRKIFSSGRQILTGLSQSLGPEITRTFGQRDWPKLYRLYDYSERIIFALIASVNVPLFVFSPILLVLWIHQPGFFDLATYTLLGVTASIICIKEHKTQFQYSTNTHVSLARVMFSGYVGMCLVGAPAIHYWGLKGFCVTWLVTEIGLAYSVVHLNQRLFAEYEKLSRGYILRLSLLCAAGFAAAYAILHQAEIAQWHLSSRIGADTAVSVAVIATAYFIFDVSHLTDFLKQKVQGRFKPAH